MNRRRVIGIVVGTIVFAILFFLTLVIVRPIYAQLTYRMSEIEKSFSTKLGDKTGLSISYKSLSPSIFSNISMSGIEIKERDSGRKLVEIRKAVMSYELKKFLSDKPLSAFETLTVSGVSVEYDKVVDSELTRNLMELFSKKENDEDKKKFSFSDFNLPFDVVVKDVSLHYSDDKNDALVRLKRLYLNDVTTDGIIIDTSGSVVVSSDIVKVGKRAGSAGVSFNLSGTFFKTLDGSSATVQLSGLGGHDLTITRLDMLASYDNSKLQFRTMRTAFPFSTLIELDFSDKKLNVAFTSDNFDPLKLVTIRKLPSIVKSLQGSKLSGNANVEYGFNNKKLIYDTKLEAIVAKSFMGQVTKFVCDGKGNDKKIDFRHFRMENSYIGVDFYGTFIFKGLKPNGVADLNYLTLPNGTTFHCEAFAEPDDVGFKCYAGQFFMNEKAYTGIEANVVITGESVDFTGSFFDYSHSDVYQPAEIFVDGSVMFGKKLFVQVNANAKNLFIDSALETTQLMLPESLSEKLVGVRNILSPYIFTGDVYVSVDVKDLAVSFNAPTCLVADYRNESSRLLFASVDGTNQLIRINDINLLFENRNVQGNFALDLSSGSDIAFQCDLFTESLPYAFSGNITSDWISVSGDYSFDAMISLGGENGISGFAQFSNLPIPLGKYVATISTMSTFILNNDGINVNIARCELSEATGSLSLDPRIAFSGEFSKYGFVFNALTYSDTTSQLDCIGKLSWAFSDNILDSASVELSGRNSISSESVSLKADLINPSHLELTTDSILNDFYLSANVSVQDFPSSRFLSNQRNENLINANIDATGTILNPFVSIHINNSSLLFSGFDLKLNGDAVLDDSHLNVSNMDASWAFFKFSGLSADFDLRAFKGNAQTTADVDLAGYKVHAPLDILMESAVSDESKSFINIPEFFSLSLNTKEISGNLLKKKVPLSLNVTSIPGRIDISTNKKKGFEASIVNGFIKAKTGENDIFSFNVEGSVNNGNLDFLFTEIQSNLAKLCNAVSIPAISFPSGLMIGNLRLSGLVSDPEFTGAVDIFNLGIDVPMVSPETFFTSNVQITAGIDGINMPDTLFSCGSGKAYLNADVLFDRWAIASVILNVSTKKFKGVPIDMDMPLMNLKGNAKADISLSINLPDELLISGNVTAESTDINIVASEFQNQLSLDGILNSLIKNSKLSMDKIFGKNKKSKKHKKANDEEIVEKDTKEDKGGGNPFVNVATDLTINIGENVRVVFNPFMRGILKPNTPINLSMDTRSGELALKGEVGLQGGEIAWINRNFYLKDGLISLNESHNSFDPRITIRAETRERDNAGNRVTIILSAQNQPISRFNPTFSSTPAKSELEIMELLGDVLTADAEDISSFAMAGGDYLVQTTIIRQIENTLRELCNFDIFSIRTNVLQNAIKQGFNQDKSNDDSKVNQNISFSNFLDNSTVYIGKYFGSAIYADAMLHLVYDETKIEEKNSVNGLVFQPEFGFELASPFVNIRFGVAPDIESILNNLWLPSTSITLSWKHSF